jgi:hypothetical protein
VLARQLTEAPPPLPPGTPAPLASLVLDLMEKSAAKRPATAAEVIARLDALHVGPSGEVQAPKLASRRNLSIVAAAGLLLLAIWFAVSGAGPRSRGAEKERVRPAPAERAGRELEATTSELLGAPSAAPLVPADGDTARAKPSASARVDTKAGAKKKPAGDADGSKRRTGPGGIYIPPPDTWFKR